MKKKQKKVETFELWPSEEKEKMEILEPVFLVAAVVDENIDIHL